MPNRIRPGDLDSARRILGQSIEEGLGKVLDRSGVEMIMRLGSAEQFANSPEELHKLLVRIFSDDAALLIERSIAGTLLDRLGEAEQDPKVLKRLARITGVAGKNSNDTELTYSLRTIRQSIGSTASVLAEAFR